eukprot:m.16555 g.16555  ORF g.16555 m.16555 type:complete len:534 (-) comp3153_c0_seq1:195-1796(-)
MDDEGDHLLSPSHSPHRLGHARFGLHWTSSLIKSVLIPIFGGTFIVGYNLSSLNLPKTVVTDHFCDHSDCIDPIFWKAIVAVYAAGGFVGALSAALFLTRWGFKMPMLLSNALMIAACLLMSLSPHASVLFLGRLVAGCASGLSTVAVPMYLTDIAPTRIRGVVGGLSQLGVALGILLSQFLALPEVLGTIDLWRWVVFVPIGPSVLQLLLVRHFVESPTWLLLYADHRNQATEVLQQLRGMQHVESIVQIIEQNKAQVLAVRHAPTFKAAFQPSATRPLWVGAAVQAAQQFSGIFSIFYYSVSFLADRDIADPSVITIMVGVLHLIATVVGAVAIERTGRRRMLLLSLAGISVFYATLTATLVYAVDAMVAVSILSIIVAYGLGLGPVAFVLTTEIFTASSAPSAMSLCVAVNWLCGLIVIATFGACYDTLGAYAFTPFLGTCVLAGILVYLYVPETRNLGIEEIAWKIHEDSDNSVQPSRTLRQQLSVTPARSLRGSTSSEGSVATPGVTLTMEHGLSTAVITPLRPKFHA